MDVGARLRQARESRGFTSEALARTTRIPHAALSAIERNEIASLPPYPFNKGFVEAYAREVGLEPHSTSWEFLEQFGARAHAPALPDPKRVAPEVYIDGPPRRFSWLALAAVALAVFWLATRTGTPAPENVPVTQTAPVPMESDAVRASVEDLPASSTSRVAPPTPAAHAGPLLAVLTTHGSAWVEARADGRRVLYELINAGAERRVSAEREITILVGDAGAVSLTVNEKSFGTLGSPRQIRVLRITPDGVQ
ncbi:MAG: helix-turn-helix domain-containing protein [Acidobacteria bacterium]|nr:helix-turn-helix domain-containing protein [Acidobacteriota bacterium]